MKIVTAHYNIQYTKIYGIKYIYLPYLISQHAFHNRIICKILDQNYADYVLEKYETWLLYIYNSYNSIELWLKYCRYGVKTLFNQSISRTLSRPGFRKVNVNLNQVFACAMVELQSVCCSIEYVNIALHRKLCLRLNKLLFN